MKYFRRVEYVDASYTYECDYKELYEITCDYLKDYTFADGTPAAISYEDFEYFLDNKYTFKTDDLMNAIVIHPSWKNYTPHLADICRDAVGEGLWDSDADLEVYDTVEIEDEPVEYISYKCINATKTNEND